jgi:hypothetical protein
VNSLTLHQRLALQILNEPGMVPDREDPTAAGLTRDDILKRSFPGTADRFADAILDALWTLTPRYVTIEHTGTRNVRFTITDAGRDAVAGLNPDLSTFDGQARALISEARGRHNWRTTGTVHPKPIELRLADMLETALRRRA